MATAPAPKPAPAPTPPTKVKLVFTVYGRMVDPLTGEVYEQTPKELVKPTGWVTSQVEAGKMAFTA